MSAIPLYNPDKIYASSVMSAVQDPPPPPPIPPSPFNIPLIVLGFLICLIIVAIILALIGVV